MYSLSICFGPAGTVWAFLFKEKEKAVMVYNTYVEHSASNATGCQLICNDDFGQSAFIPFGEIRGMVLEDLDQHEQARIQRALADERLKAKFMQAAKSDPIIRAAMGNQQSPIMTPMSGGFRGN